MINPRLALPIFFSKPVVLRAVKVAIIVGVILAFINHGGLILSGNITTECWVKMLITCFVPYTVSSATATMNILEQSNTQSGIAREINLQL